MIRTDDRPRDPVCGMTAGETFQGDHDGRTFYFCSEHCRTLFFRDPDYYLMQREYYGGWGQAIDRRIAYFSIEVGIDPRIPTYSGGLGVLAGDMIRSCADLQIPVVAVTLLARRGYFAQELDGEGVQRETPVEWRPEESLRALSSTVEVRIEDRRVVIRAWQYDAIGRSGHVVPVFFLDTDIAENGEADRALSDTLYGGDERYRLAQEIILGIGGIRMLECLGHRGIEIYHMNEGHSSLLAVELLRRRSPMESTHWDFQAVRDHCVFTTHTPVPAGHDSFSYELVESMLGDLVPIQALKMLAGPESLNMTALALNMSRYINGVARRHGEISRTMFPGHPIHSITNGVHAYAWTGDAFRELYDRHIPDWARDPYTLRNALNIPGEEFRTAHERSKARLVDLIHERTGRRFDPGAFTIGFARRATMYKRADLVFRDVERLRGVSKRAGRLQFVFAGKAHPQDLEGKELIRRVVSAGKRAGPEVDVVYLENYDMEMARCLVAGVDLWLNTPRKPNEASATSGMKAALNGVPCLSVLDGWWTEGCIEGVTGWSLGSSAGGEGSGDDEEARELYDKLESVIVPMYSRQPERWSSVMQHCVAINGSFFNTHRMVQQYALKSYLGYTRQTVRPARPE